jgi:hypothetical protein
VIGQAHGGAPFIVQVRVQGRMGVQGVHDVAFWQRCAAPLLFFSQPVSGLLVV